MPTRDEADSALEHALNLLAEAYEWAGVRTNHLLFIEHQRLNADDTTSTIVGCHVPDRQSWTATLGVLRAGTLRIESDYVRAEREDD
jgi:hypothetical protein